MASGNRAYKNKTGIKAHSQSNFILPALLSSLVKLSLSPHQGTRGRLIKWCECYALWLVVAHDLSEYKAHGWRHGKFVFLVLFNMARGFEKCLWDYFGLSKRKPRKKSLAEAIYKEEKWRDGGKRVLHYFRMPKPQEIFATVAIVHRVSSPRGTLCFAKCFRFVLSKRRLWKTLRGNCM